MSLPWKLASNDIQNTQTSQKKMYDTKAGEVDLRVGERVMVLMPSEIQGKEWKLASPFHGPYRVIQVTSTNAEVCLIDPPKSDSIFVALEHLRRCYPKKRGET